MARRTKKPLKESEIVLKILGRCKVGKHFAHTIGDGSFQSARREDSITQEATLDGIYVIRTSESKERLSAEDRVRSYSGLS